MYPPETEDGHASDAEAALLGRDATPRRRSIRGLKRLVAVAVVFSLITAIGTPLRRVRTTIESNEAPGTAEFTQDNFNAPALDPEEVRPIPALDEHGFPLRVKSKVKAAYVMLVDPRDDPRRTMLRSMASVEQHYGVYEHDWFIFLEKELDSDIAREAEAMAPGRVRWAALNASIGWGLSPGVTMEQAVEWANTPAANGQTFRLMYRYFCRWFSGFAYSHAAMADYEYLWRIDTDVQYDCSTFDPIDFMAERGLAYGFHRARGTQVYTRPTLGDKLDAFLAEYPDFKPRNEQFVRDDGAYNGLAFTNNFEIVSRKWFTSEEYRLVFDWLDRSNGFYSERWCARSRSSLTYKGRCTSQSSDRCTHAAAGPSRLVRQHDRLSPWSSSKGLDLSTSQVSVLHRLRLRS